MSSASQLTPRSNGVVDSWLTPAAMQTPDISSVGTSSRSSYQCEVGRGIYTLPNSPSHRSPEMRVCESDPTCIVIGCYMIRPSEDDLLGKVGRDKQ